MRDEFQRPALEILLKVYSSEEEKIHRETIENEVEAGTDEFIAFMEKIDLLETESDPNVYFLTPMAYELLERKSLEDYLYHVFNPADQSENSEEVDDDDFPVLINLESFARPGGRSIYTTILLFALIMALVMVVSNGIRPSSNSDEVYPGLSEEAQQAIIDSVEEFLARDTNSTH